MYNNGIIIFISILIYVMMNGVLVSNLALDWLWVYGDDCVIDNVERIFYDRK